MEDLPQVTAAGPEINLSLRRSNGIPPLGGTICTRYRVTGKLITMAMTDETMVIQIDDSLSFELNIPARRIRCFATYETPYKLLRYWILQQVLPIFFILEGSFDFLHCTAVSTLALSDEGRDVPADAGCIGFHGESYAGKSTMLSYFLSRGHVHVTDDHLALSRVEAPYIVPSIPYYRPYRRTEDLGVLAKNYSPDPRPLERIYLLAPEAPDADVSIEEVTRHEALALFLGDRRYVPFDQRVHDYLSLTANRFSNLSKLARCVPVVRLHVPRSLERLPEVYDFIQNDLAVIHA